MIHRLLFPLIVSLTSLMLVSCATVGQRVITEPAGWAADQEKRQQIKIWEIRGRLGVQTENNGGTMDIIWKQSDEAFSIRLIAPLGAGTYLIQGDNDLAEIRFPDGQRKTLSNIDDVFSSTLEIDLSANAVKDWIRGLPAAALPVENISWNDQGLLETVRQAGWNVEMKKYTGNEILLPHVIYLSRDDNSDIDVRLVLRQWLVDN